MNKAATRKVRNEALRIRVGPDMLGVDDHRPRIPRPAAERQIVGNDQETEEIGARLEHLRRLISINGEQCGDRGVIIGLADAEFASEEGRIVSHAFHEARIRKQLVAERKMFVSFPEGIDELSQRHRQREHVFMPVQQACQEI